MTYTFIYKKKKFTKNCFLKLYISKPLLTRPKATKQLRHFVIYKTVYELRRSYSKFYYF